MRLAVKMLREGPKGKKEKGRKVKRGKGERKSP
jgi:hypothetical protein